MAQAVPIIAAVIGAAATVYSSRQQARAAKAAAAPIPELPGKGAAEAAAEKERQRLAAKKGRGATLLTSPLGVQDEAVLKPTLLGGK